MAPNHEGSVRIKRGVSKNAEAFVRVNIHVPSTDLKPFRPFEGKIPKDLSELLFVEYEVDIQSVKDVLEFAIEDFNK